MKTLNGKINFLLSISCFPNAKLESMTYYVKQAVNNYTGNINIHLQYKHFKNDVLEVFTYLCF